MQKRTTINAWILLCCVLFFLPSGLSDQFHDTYISSDDSLLTSHCSQRFYKGDVRQTVSGFACLKWADSPDDFKPTPSDNLCRNPDHDPNGPWCYTDHPYIKYDYCLISGQCPRRRRGARNDCKRTKLGTDFQGTVKTTKSGKPCLYWGSAMNQLDATLKKQKNYCRNPDRDEGGPWCYVDGDKIMEGCDIKWCDDSKILLPLFINHKLVHGSEKDPIPAFKSNNFKNSTFAEDSRAKAKIGLKTTPRTLHRVSVSFETPTKISHYEFRITKEETPEEDDQAIVALVYTVKASEDKCCTNMEKLNSFREKRSSFKVLKSVANPGLYQCYSFEIENQDSAQMFSVRLEELEFKETIDPDHSPSTVERLCGRRRKDQVVYNQAEENVLGGILAERNAFPWQVAFLNLKAYHNNRRGHSHIVFCGGSIIDDRHILTAAHCVKNTEKWKKETKIVAGKLDFYTEEDAQTFDIDVVYRHSYSSLTMEEDIAIIRLNQTIEFNAHILPICLPSNEPAHDLSEGDYVTISGWGEVTDGKTPDRLQVAKVKVHNLKGCNRDFKNYRKGRDETHYAITEKQFCAKERNVDTCKGDSGGPVIKKIGNRYVQVGIVSFGPKPCSVPDNPPSVYTKVKSYLNWINEKISEKKTNTVRLCKDDQFMCQNEYCISKNQVCDGTHDCKGGYDEINCEIEQGKREKGKKGEKENLDPWVAQIYVKEGRKWHPDPCSATIIDEYHLLTSKPCAPRKTEFESRRLHVVDPNANDRANKVNLKILPHSVYPVSSVKNFGNLILIKVGKEIVFGPNARPIALWPFTEKINNYKSVGLSQSEQSKLFKRVQMDASPAETEACETTDTYELSWFAEGSVCMQENRTIGCSGPLGGAVVTEKNDKVYLVGVIDSQCADRENGTFSYISLKNHLEDIKRASYPIAKVTNCPKCHQSPNCHQSLSGFCLKDESDVEKYDKITPERSEQLQSSTSFKSDVSHACGCNLFVTQIPNRIWPSGYGQVAVAREDEIYVTAGVYRKYAESEEEFLSTETFWIFNTSTSTWKQDPAAGETTGIRGIFRGCAQQLAGKLYVRGNGMGGYDTVFSAYDFTKKMWENVTSNGPKPIGRRGFKCFKSDEKIVFFGGRNWGAADKLTNQVISYDVEDKVWKDVKTSNTPSARSDMALVQVKDAVYIHGGWAADGPLEDFWKLDLKTWTWTKIKDKQPSPGLKEHHSLAALSNDLLLLVGGWDADHNRTAFLDRPSREVWTFNTTRNEWKLHDQFPKEALGNKADGIYDHKAVSVSMSVLTSAVSVQGGNGERSVFVLGGNTEYQKDMKTHQMKDVLKYETVC